MPHHAKASAAAKSVHALAGWPVPQPQPLLTFGELPRVVPPLLPLPVVPLAEYDVLPVLAPPLEPLLVLLVAVLPVVPLVPLVLDELVDDVAPVLPLLLLVDVDTDGVQPMGSFDSSVPSGRTP